MSSADENAPVDGAANADDGAANAASVASADDGGANAAPVAAPRRNASPLRAARDEAEMPRLGVLLADTFTHLFLAIGFAAGVGGVCHALLNGAYQQLEPDAESFGLPVALATAGVQPAVLVAVCVWAFGVIVLGRLTETFARSPWAVPVVMLGLGAGIGLIPPGAIEEATRATAGGFYPTSSVPAAMANLPPRGWALGLAAGLAWLSGRRADPLIAAAAWVCVGFVVWELGMLRMELWSGAVDQVLAEGARTGSGAADGAAKRFDQARWAMAARSLSDLLVLASPMIVVRTHTRRAESAALRAAARLR